MENIRVDKKEEYKIEMPSHIRIGDPMYFEEDGDSFKYVYARGFRRKDWFGSMIIRKEVDLDLVETFGREISNVSAFIVFAPNEKLLEVYKEGSYYSNQKEKTTEIGVDTARYMIEINNDRYIEINTDSDGLMGDVIELYNGNKLEGIMIELNGLDANTFERFSEEMKYVFGAK